MRQTRNLRINHLHICSRKEGRAEKSGGRIVV